MKSNLLFVASLAIFLFFTEQTAARRCSEKPGGPPTGCCPTKYLANCCPLITKPCNQTIVPSRPPLGQKGRGTGDLDISGGKARAKPFCILPWNSSACQDGFFLDKRTKRAKPCPPGFFCPNNQLCIIPCPLGAFCVSNKLVRAKKTSDDMCQKAGLCCDPANVPPVYDPNKKRYICPGPKKPDPCPAGSYCPKVTTKILCPSGHYCREGSVEPDPCPIMTYCKKGISAPLASYGGPLLVLFLLLIFLIMIAAFNRRRTIKTYWTVYRDKYMSSRFRTDRTQFQNEAGMQSMEQLPELASCRSRIVPKSYIVDIAFEDLSLTLKSGLKKKVLMGVRGMIKSGEVTAIMGPSGAGKTTFLNTISGKAYYGRRDGKIYINEKLTENLDVFRTITGFVPQEDIMHRNLTVKEVLTYQAELRLPANISDAERIRKVEQVIEILDLEGVQDSEIGDEETRGISGGQRKRVNIGMELVTDPTLLFLDEPTSGLDSTSSLAVMNALKAVAEKGRLTVMCVIHQPRYEIFRMFHNVLFLGPGGRTVFQGGVEEAEGYFAGLGYTKPLNINPADFYMDVIGGQYTAEESDKSLFEKYETYQCERGQQASSRDNFQAGRNGEQNRSATNPEEWVPEEFDVNVMRARNTGSQSQFTQRVMPGVLWQFVTFLSREVVLQFRIKKSLLIDQALVLLAGGVLGALHSEKPLKEFFMLQTLSSLAIGLTAMLSSLRCFGSHRTTFWRESASGVNRFSYFMAVNVAQLPIIVISPLIYLSLLYVLTSPRGLFKFHYLATLGAQFTCTGAGYLFSIVFNPKNSQMASVVFVLVNGLLSGSSPSLCSLDKLVISTAFYNLSFARWYLEALFEKEANRYPAVSSPMVQGLAIKNGYSLDNYSVCIMALFLLGLGYRILAFLCLLFTNRGKQK